jgi:hypothetical protein
VAPSSVAPAPSPRSERNAASTSCVTASSVPSSANSYCCRISSSARCASAIAAVFGLMLLIGAAAIAIAVGFVHSWGLEASWRDAPSSQLEPLATGAAFGLLAAGLSAGIARVLPAGGPVSPGFGGADAFLPVFAAAIGPISGFVTTTLMLLIILAGVDRVTDGWRVRRVQAGIAAVLLGTVMFAARVPDIQWAGLLPSAIGGFALLAVYLLARRTHLALVPPAVAVSAVLALAPQFMVRPYPGAAAGAAIGALAVLALALLWSRLLQRPAAAGGSDFLSLDTGAVDAVQPHAGHGHGAQQNRNR